MMFWKAFLAPAALVGLASAVALPPTNGLDPNTHSLNKRTATMWTWFPPLVPETPWKYLGCYSGEVPLTYHVADFCTCHNKATDAVKAMTMEKCFASCKGAGFRYAGLKGANGAKQCWCGSADPAEYKLNSGTTCNVPCGDGEGNLAKKYNENQCGGISTYSIWKDTCYKKFDIEKAPLGYESAGCWSGHGGWLLAHFEKSVSGDNLSIDSCVEACSANGYPYAGMRGGWECFCGGRLSPYFVDIHQKNPQHSTMCTKVCTATWKVYATLPKEEWQYCGGDVYYSLYYNRNLAASTTCSDDDDDKPVVKVTQTITIKGTVTPPVATQTYDKDKTTRVTTTVPADATPKPTDETEEPDNNNDDDDDDGDDEKVTKTVTRTEGGPEPTETAGEGTVLVTTTVPAPKGAKTITVTQTGTQTLTYKSNKKTVYVTVTVPAVQTVTITQTSGSPAPKTPKSNKKTVYIVITVPARQTVTITQTVGDAAQTTPKANKKTIYVIVTVPRRGPNRGVKTITVTYTKGGRSLTYKPNKSTVYVTTTVPATKPSDDPEDDPEDGENNPGGKGTDEENPDDKKDDGEKPDDKKDDGENPDDKKDDGENPDDKKDDGENPDDKKDDGENPDDKKDDGEKPDDKKDDEGEPDDEGKPGGKGGEPGDEGPDPIDSLCFRPIVPSIVLKVTKWKSIKFPVGDVYAPAVSCHNRKDKFDANYHFKLYVGPGTKWPDAVCRTDYTHKATEVQAACHNACIEQSKSCEASPKVQKLANYKDLCKHQLDACKAINTLKLFPKQIQGINDGYCKKHSPPFPKPPKTGGKPQKGEDLSYD